MALVHILEQQNTTRESFKNGLIACTTVHPNLRLETSNKLLKTVPAIVFFMVTLYSMGPSVKSSIYYSLVSELFITSGDGGGSLLVQG